MLRALILILLLGSFGWWLDREHQAGRFQRVDELFLDFLVANTRERFVLAKDQALKESPVVFVKMRTADKAEYAGWPPRPLDWRMILKGLQPYEPAVVVVPETLFWGRPPPEFVAEAAQALLPIPSTVLGVEAELATTRDTPAFLGGLENSLPVFQKVHGDMQSVPPLKALISAPDELMRAQAELGIAISRREKETVLLPYAVQEDGRLRPTVLAQALARFTKTPYAKHRLALETGSGAYLADGVFVNLTRNAEWVCMDRTVPEVDALNLMTTELAEALSPQDKQHLSGGKLIVIGTDDGQTGGLARQHAVALAEILAMPRLRLLPDWAQWIIWGAAGLAGLWLVLFVPRKKAILRGLLCIFAALVTCFLAFQSSLIWCPPTIPAALLAVSAVFARVAGRRISPAS